MSLALMSQGLNSGGRRGGTVTGGVSWAGESGGESSQSLPGQATDLGPQSLPWLTAPPQGLLQSSMDLHCTVREAHGRALSPPPAGSVLSGYAAGLSNLPQHPFVCSECVGGGGAEKGVGALWNCFQEQDRRGSATFTGSPVPQETSDS